MSTAITVTATLTGALGPFYFDQPCTVTVTVRNTGAAPVQVLPPAVKGFFYSPRMENTVTFHTPAPPNAINGPVLMLNATAVGVPEIKTNHIIAQVGVDVALAPNGMNPPFDGGIRLPQWVTLAPGEEKTLPVTLLCGKPASWAVLAPDLYILTVVNVCATVQVTLPADNGARNYNIITPWKDALVGSPLPKEAEALAGEIEELTGQSPAMEMETKP